MTREYTRRHVLAGLGTVGAGFAGSLALFTGKSRAYTSYTHVSRQGQESTPTGRSGSEQHGLRVAWWESYNGRMLETQGDGGETSASDALESETDPRFVPEATGPIVSVGNVLPGDEGTVGIGVEADVPGNGELGDGVHRWQIRRLLRQHRPQRAHRFDPRPGAEHPIVVDRSRVPQQPSEWCGVQCRG